MSDTNTTNTINHHIEAWIETARSLYLLDNVHPLNGLWFQLYEATDTELVKNRDNIENGGIVCAMCLFGAILYEHADDDELSKFVELNMRGETYQIKALLAQVIERITGFQANEFVWVKNLHGHVFHVRLISFLIDEWDDTYDRSFGNSDPFEAFAHRIVRYTFATQKPADW